MTIGDVLTGRSVINILDTVATAEYPIFKIGAIATIENSEDIAVGIPVEELHQVVTILAINE